MIAITTIKMNLQYKIACIMVTGEDLIIRGMVNKELNHCSCKDLGKLRYSKYHN